MCCTALIASYPFSACRGKKSFYRALKQYPEVFDEFLIKTADLFRSFVKCFVPLETLKIEMCIKQMDCPVLQEYAILDGENQIALLKLGASAVQLVWCTKEGQCFYTIKFPYWCNFFTDRMDTYLMKMWGWLAMTLLTLAGFSATYYAICPVDAGQIEAVTPAFYFNEQCVSSINELYELMKQNLKEQIVCLNLQQGKPREHGLHVSLQDL